MTSSVLLNCGDTPGCRLEAPRSNSRTSSLLILPCTHHVRPPWNSLPTTSLHEHPQETRTMILPLLLLARLTSLAVGQSSSTPNQALVIDQKSFNALQSVPPPSESNLTTVSVTRSYRAAIVLNGFRSSYLLASHKNKLWPNPFISTTTPSTTLSVPILP